MRFHTSTVNIRDVAMKIAQVSFCYLASATIAGAKH